MSSLKNIKLKIQSVKKTRQVTKAMEAVSAVKMRKTQEQVMGSRPYAVAALSVLQRLSTSVDLSHESLFSEIPSGKTCLILITSDKGLAGSLNSSMTRAAERLIIEKQLSPENTITIAIGRRGAEFLTNRGFEIRYRLENVSDQVDESELRTLTDDVLTLREQKEINFCYVAYTNFLSTFEQVPVIHQILPLDSETLRGMVEGIAPIRGKYASERRTVEAPAAYTVEPEAKVVLEEVMPKLLSIALFHALVEAKASEHSARMVAMKNATDKAGEVAHDLTLVFNKARQAAITSEVSEITSGIEAMR